MTDMHARRAEIRLGAALEGLAVACHGATAHPGEHNHECRGGSADELALLKVPGVRLDPDLLRRTWQVPDLSDHGAVLRRILPQLAGTLVDSRSESFRHRDEIGGSLARGRWQEWPPQQAAAVHEFLHAFWAYGLLTPALGPTPFAHAHRTLVLCVEASGELGPWLRAWEALEHPVADRNLAEAAESWSCDLLGDELPWNTRHDKAALLTTLTSWLARHAAPRLTARGAPGELLHHLRLLGLSLPDRRDDPHWPRDLCREPPPGRRGCRRGAVDSVRQSRS
ncbi:hypothetical protein [Kitasatospora sp. NPDC008115]|uniref:hypothetical protein n=1 Tax=Kitasatospora sp. NPDC008115 TaxID=3364022 RepID=UPI0036EBD491